MTYKSMYRITFCNQYWPTATRTNTALDAAPIQLSKKGLAIHLTDTLIVNKQGANTACTFL